MEICFLPIELYGWNVKLAIEFGGCGKVLHMCNYCRGVINELGKVVANSVNLIIIHKSNENQIILSGLFTELLM